MVPGEVESTGISLRRGRMLSREAELIGAGVIILSISFAYPYVEGFIGSVSPGCLMHRLTGIPCLLCGMTRSLAATAHGQFSDAFRLHLLGPPFFAVVLVATVLLAAEYALSRRILPRPGPRTWKYIGWGTLGLLAAAWVARLTFFGINV
jgi:hypothetical protein